MHTTTDNPNVHLDESPGFGLGLFAKKRIKKGELIATFDGPSYTWDNITNTISAEFPNNPEDHAIQYAEFSARDSLGLARYANHSCRPNAGIVGLFDITALEDIAPGVEIRWDYAMSEDSSWYLECQCGEVNCRQIIGGYRFLSPELRHQYQGFISTWLLDPYRAYVGEAKDVHNTFPHPSMPGRTPPTT